MFAVSVPSNTQQLFGVLLKLGCMQAVRVCSHASQHGHASQSCCACVAIECLLEL